MKKLFICLTDFQILNALNLQVNNENNEDADIFFVTNKQGNEELAARLQATKIFKNVYLFNNSKISGLHRYFRNLTEKKYKNSFISAFTESAREVFYKICSKIYGLEYKVNKKVIFGKEIDFSIYDRIFCLDKRQIVVDVVNAVKKKTNGKCKISLLDEGTSTYWRSILETHFPIDDIYLYQPNLANYYYDKNWCERFKVIPKIDWKDQKFRKIINYVFEFVELEKNGNKLLEVKNKIIFFDQNWDPMPKYFDHLPSVLRFLLHKPYKKHKKESRFYDAKMEMFRIVANNCLNNEVMVKLHPRSPDDFVEDYKISECSLAKNLKVPWEVFMDNCSFKNNIWITVSSTALCTYKTAFCNHLEDIPMVFLYKIVYKDKMDFREDDEFFEKFQSRYPGSVFLPKTVEEFQEIYAKLVTKMSQRQ